MVMITTLAMEFSSGQAPFCDHCSQNSVRVQCSQIGLETLQRHRQKERHVGRPTDEPPKRRPSRGRPAELTREQITAAAVAVADAEGLEAVTMRRLAAELGAGAASLYRHVTTRSELVTRMVDQALGEADPTTATGDWRADIVAANLGWLRYLRRRPWLLDAIAGRSLGSNALRLLEDNLRLIAPSHASGPEKIEAITMLGGLVHTIAQQESSQERISDRERLAAQVDSLRRAVSDGSHPNLAAALASPNPNPGESNDERVARVLRRVLNGLLPD
jgi:AcrR family transcriptional regulator